MTDLDAQLERARELDVGEIADAIETIGFECTRCGACCRGFGDDHTATIFPDEVRAIDDTDAPARRDESSDRLSSAEEIDPGGYDWRDVARPMPFGLTEDDGVLSGETFEWAIQTDDCGDCTFFERGDGGSGAGGCGDSPGCSDETERGEPDPDPPRGRCTVYDDRPLICRTYPFSVELGITEPMGDVVDLVGPVRAHECEGIGRQIDRRDAEELAVTLKDRTIREVEESMAVRDAYEPVDPEPGDVVVHDSEGAKRPDGSTYR